MALVPWQPNDAPRHNKAAKTEKAKRIWSTVATDTLEQTGDEVLAMRYANAAVKRHLTNKAKGKK